ncbi:MAG: polyamine aminopropyltransferase [Deltaproteobacteria bacterium]|jgi:spermidine synthase|nr:polyamine aminopropyltransferase [Deltaproteobacteria bacterium]
MELWFTEYHHNTIGFSLKVKETLFVSESKYQRIQVLDTEAFGRVLLLDGLFMTTDRDEWTYHELLVHPAMFLHSNPEQVLVIGGGDGGAIREVVRHDTVKKAVLCEIDGLVIETCKRFFPQIACELTGNPRVEVQVRDGVQFMEENQTRFDVILVDSTDPIGPAVGLFQADFYKKCLASLKEDGILVAQSESPFYDMEILKAMQNNLKAAGFPIVRFYWGFVPTYPSGMWSWVMASKKYDPLTDMNLKKAKQRMASMPLKYMTPELLRSVFDLPAFFKQAVS